MGVAAAAPFAGYAKGIPFQGPAPGILQVYLEGPFAIVMKKDSSGKIQEVNAYAPVEATRKHKLHFRNKDQDNSKDYTFTIPKDGLTLGTSVGSVSGEFDSFKGTAAPGLPKLESFITVKLPPEAPEQIIFSLQFQPR
jgi:hypothetical protein